ncbi:MAG: xanthine dehydrogenase family protein molybdopterin-binding subunit [Rhodovarius sp.]|nr:xanthine dehydrogenase family protein molybdopterin-binding subunit [Rhodovarius sp.]
MSWIGAPLRRFEDRRFLTGEGRFVADVEVPGAAWLAVVRSPHAHARLGAITAPAAVRLITAADLAAAGIGRLPCPAEIGVPIARAERPVLAQGVVRHVGEPVAFVLADSPAAARDAAEAVAVEYAPLPAVTDPWAALAPGAPQLHEQAPGNLAFDWQKGDALAVEQAFARAAHITRLSIANRRVSAAPIEPRAAIALSPTHLLCNGQAVHGMRRQIARCMGIEEAALRIEVPDVGGGFGLKNIPFPEHIGLLFAARLLGRPVRWVSDQAEDFAASCHGRGLHALAELALDAEGRFLALRIAAVAELGAYASPHGPACPTQAAGTAYGGGYAIPAIHVQVRGAYTNTAPIEAYRGAGKPEANFIIEMLVEAAARQCGLDPAALRARNLVAAHPHTTAMGMAIADGAFPRNLAAAEAAADRPGLPARRAESAARGRLRGLGVACYLETARGAFGEWARLTVKPDGRVEIAIGTHSNGQGHETAFAQIAADQLGLPPEAFLLVQGDTARIERGGGHGGARSLHQGGRALVEAAAALIEAGRAEAARLLQADPAALRYSEGRYLAPSGASLPVASLAGLSASAAHESALCTFPHGAHVAEVEVDPETGEVALLRYLAFDDAGVVVNPLLAAGQIQGGVAQGIGQALMEAIAYDGEGQLLSAGLMDYALPRAADLPDLPVVLLPGCPASVNPLGVKGVGQAGAIAAPQAVMAAVLDALAGLGVTWLDMPATPQRVWEAIRSARRAGTAGR